MRILARIGLVLAALLAVLILVIAVQPAEFAIERSKPIEAPPEVVYPHIADLHAFNAWNPFARMDPEMTLRYDGPEAGVGASSSWVAPQMGKGRMTITRVEPDREVEMKLEFFEPMAGTNRVLFGLAPEGAATRVSWRMEGRNNFVGKAMALFADMDGMMGESFDRGLENLKLAAEAEVRERALAAAETEAARRLAEQAADTGVPPQGDQVPVEE
jgi:hypothetical protein